MLVSVTSLINDVLGRRFATAVANTVKVIRFQTDEICQRTREYQRSIYRFITANIADFEGG